MFKKEIPLIAEIAGNFSTVEEAIKLGTEAIKKGAESVKLQTYRADLLASKEAMFNMPNTGKKSQYEVFKESEIPYAMQREIITELKSRGVEVFSTPSHIEDLEFLLDCGVTRIKIGSDDCSNFPLIRAAGESGHPVIVSTGMATIEEVGETIDFCAKVCADFAIMHCTTNYPCQLSELNLATIKTLTSAYPGMKIGFSDHYPDNISSVLAFAAGARFFEKHVMFDDVVYGYDAPVSLKLNEMATYFKELEACRTAMGSAFKKLSSAELVNRKNNRKSLHFTRTVEAGAVLTPADLIALRPGDGIPPSLTESVIGKSLTRSVSQGEKLEWQMLA